MVERLKPKPQSLLQELEEELRIDENALNDVCREHPTVFYRVAREVALAISRRDAAKVDLEKTEAQVSIYMRELAAKGDKKMTIDEAKARVKEDPDYLAAVDRLATRQEQVGQWSALKDAFQQRSYALNHMVDLYLANYYGSIERRESSEERTATAGRARENMIEMRRAAAEKREPAGRKDGGWPER